MRTDRADWPEQWELVLDRYLARECSPVEGDAVEAWLGDDPGHRAVFEQLRQVRARAGVSSDAEAPVDVNAALHRVGRILGSDVDFNLTRERRHPTMLRSSMMPLYRRHGLTAVLSVCGVLLVALSVRLYQGSHSGWQRYVTAPGHREQVTLADGTRITLAPATELRVPTNYAAGNRSVVLQGEGYFEVVHESAHPFAVRAGNIVATDIGTHFDVRAYGDETAAHVTVTEGRVGLERLGSRPVPAGTAHVTMLNAGDVATVSNDGLALTRIDDLTSTTGWTMGTLAFHATPLATVARELGRWYDLDVRVPDTGLAAIPLTGSYTTQSVDQVLSLITAAVGAHYERHGRAVLITPRGLTH